MRSITKSAAAAFSAAALLALGGAATATAAAPHAQHQHVTVAADTAPTTTTLPLFGASLTVDVTTGPGGALTSVTVDPSTDLTATRVSPGSVKFVNADGTAKVEVKSRGGGQKVSAKAGQLSDISGPGSWSGDVFDNGTTSNVTFTVGAAADGGPDITGVTATGETNTVGDTKYRGHDDHQAAFASVKFTNGGQARMLVIAVEVSSRDDNPKAKITVALTRVVGVRQAAADAAGPHTWTGTLCDGTAATINYTVNADGTLSDVVATPDTAVVKTGDNGMHGDDGSHGDHRARVTFSEHERVTISVRSSEDGSMLKVSVDERIRCVDATDPSVNTPISEPPTTIDDGNGGTHDGDHNDGDHSGGGRDGGGHHGGHGGGGDDDSTTSTEMPTTSTNA